MNLDTPSSTDSDLFRHEPQAKSAPALPGSCVTPFRSPSLVDAGQSIRASSSSTNGRTYPSFCRLLDALDFPFAPTEMSFSVRREASGLESSGASIDSLFAARRNPIRPGFWTMIADTLRFRWATRALLSSPTRS